MWVTSGPMSSSVSIRSSWLGDGDDNDDDGDGEHGGGRWVAWLAGAPDNTGMSESQPTLAVMSTALMMLMITLPSTLMVMRMILAGDGSWNHWNVGVQVGLSAVPKLPLFSQPGSPLCLFPIYFYSSTGKELLLPWLSEVFVTNKQKDWQTDNIANSEVTRGRRTVGTPAINRDKRNRN